MKFYTLTECSELLGIDPKTLRKWIKDAGMDAIVDQQVSKYDSRLRYLTEQQLRDFAEQHRRPLDLSQQEETERVITPSTYKRLLDQMDRLDESVSGIQSQQQEDMRQIDARLEAMRQELEGQIETKAQGVQDELWHEVNILRIDLKQHAELQMERVRQDLSEQITREQQALATSLQEAQVSWQQQQIEHRGQWERDQEYSFEKRLLEIEKHYRSENEQASQKMDQALQAMQQIIEEQAKRQEEWQQAQEKIIQDRLDALQRQLSEQISQDMVALTKSNVELVAGTLEVYQQEQTTWREKQEKQQELWEQEQKSHLDRIEALVEAFNNKKTPVAEPEPKKSRRKAAKAPDSPSIFPETERQE